MTDFKYDPCGNKFESQRAAHGFRDTLEEIAEDLNEAKGSDCWHRHGGSVMTYTSTDYAQDFATQVKQHRLSAADVKRYWLLGDYSARGYLAQLCQCLNITHADQIGDGSEFCRVWNISKPSFNRAKHELKKQGRLK